MRNTKIKRTIFFVTTIILSVPLGGVIGFIVGLISITFVPACCDDNGCHSCAKFHELVGYEATATLGFWIGLFLIPVVYVSLLTCLKLKKKL